MKWCRMSMCLVRELLVVVTAKSTNTFVITVLRNFIKVKSVSLELGLHPKDLRTASRTMAMYSAYVVDIAVFVVSLMTKLTIYLQDTEHFRRPFLELDIQHDASASAVSDNVVTGNDYSDGHLSVQWTKRFCKVYTLLLSNILCN
ncbi:hypothetical protein Tco_1102134 [Tanacetum coccineum]